MQHYYSRHDIHKCVRIASHNFRFDKITFFYLFQRYQTLHKFIFVKTKQYFCKKITFDEIC